MRNLNDTKIEALRSVIDKARDGIQCVFVDDQSVMATDGIMSIAFKRNGVDVIAGLPVSIDKEKTTKIIGATQVFSDVVASTPFDGDLLRRIAPLLDGAIAFIEIIKAPKDGFLLRIRQRDRTICAMGMTHVDDWEVSIDTSSETQAPASNEAQA